MSSISFDQEEVEGILQQIKSNTSAGPSGCDGNYIHHLSKSDKARTMLVKTLHLALNDLLNNPNRMSEIPELYQYKSIYIPKPNGSFRHIAI